MYWRFINCLVCLMDENKTIIGLKSDNLFLFANVNNNDENKTIIGLKFN